MSVIENLFSRSPFTPMQVHMEKVALCVDKLYDLFDAFNAQDHKLIQSISKEISKLEHSADMTKNEIRNNLPRGLFLAIKRPDLLQILSLQDSIADKAEDIGILMTIKKLDPLEEIKEELDAFVKMNIKSVEQVHLIFQELDELMEYSFGGTEASKVSEMIDSVAAIEHEVDIIQRVVLKKLYNMEKKLDYASFSLWLKIFDETASLGNLSEKLANRVAMLLETR